MQRKSLCHMFEDPGWHSHPRSLTKTFFVHRHIIVIYSVIVQRRPWSYYAGSITKTRLFKYIENFTSKNWKFSGKTSDIFHTSAQNIDCGYSLEPPRWGGSNEYPQSMVWAEIRKIMYTPVNPSFII